MTCKKCGKRKWHDGITLGNVGDPTDDGGVIESRTYGDEATATVRRRDGSTRVLRGEGRIAGAVDQEAWKAGLCQCPYHFTW